MRHVPAGWHPRSRFIDVDGWTAHFVDIGDSKVPIIFLHGFLVSSWAWRFNLRPLARHARIIAPCQKGFGWSDKRGDDYSLSSLGDFAIRLLDHLGVERAHWVGNSLGGAVALYIAAHHPERVERLVLVDAAGVPFRREVRMLTKGLQSWMAPVCRVGGRSLVFQALLRTFAYANIPVDRRYMEGFMAPLMQGGSFRSAIRVISSLNDGLRELFPRLESIRKPTLIVWGAKDRLVPLKAAHILNQRLYGSDLVVFEECGHCPMEEAPDRFNRLLIDFLS
jgi:pimeloyl-ACP methyl ester carboxylesterase